MEVHKYFTMCSSHKYYNILAVW